MGQLGFFDLNRRSVVDLDKAHGGIEQRSVSIAREVDWPGASRLSSASLRAPNSNDHGRFRSTSPWLAIDAAAA